MKRNKKLFLAVLSAACLASGAVALTSCGDEQAHNDEIYSIYQQYVAYAEANNAEPKSYEDWLEEIKGAQGEQGAKGDQGTSAYEAWLNSLPAGDEKASFTEAQWLAWLKGSDGRGIVRTELNRDGDLVVYYTDNTTDVVYLHHHAFDGEDDIVVAEPTSFERGVAYHFCDCGYGEAYALEKLTYEVTVYLPDGVTPAASVFVKLGDEERLTDENGKAVFTEFGTYGEYPITFRSMTKYYGEPALSGTEKEISLTLIPIPDGAGTETDPYVIEEAGKYFVKEGSYVAWKAHATRNTRFYEEDDSAGIDVSANGLFTSPTPCDSDTILVVEKIVYEGDSEYPYTLKDGVNTLYVPAEGAYAVTTDNYFSDSRVYTYDESQATVSYMDLGSYVPLASGTEEKIASYNTIRILPGNGEIAAFSLNRALPEGTSGNPIEIAQLGTISRTNESGREYYFTFTPEENGYYTVRAGAGVSQISVSDGDVFDENIQSASTLGLTAGTTYAITVNQKYDATAFSFTLAAYDETTDQLGTSKSAPCVLNLENNAASVDVKKAGSTMYYAVPGITAYGQLSVTVSNAAGDLSIDEYYKDSLYYTDSDFGYGATTENGLYAGTADKPAAAYVKIANYYLSDSSVETYTVHVTFTPITETEAHTVNVTVNDAAGTELDGKTIMLTKEGEAPIEAVIANGVATFNLLPGNFDYDVSFKEGLDEDYRLGVSTVTTNLESREITVSVEKKTALTLTVTKDGAPFTGIVSEITLNRVMVAENVDLSQTNGVYTISVFIEDYYDVSFGITVADMSSADYEIGDSETTDENAYTIAITTKVAYSVTLSGLANYNGVKVTLENGRGVAVATSAEISADGVVTFDQKVVPGVYAIVVTSENYYAEDCSTSESETKYTLTLAAKTSYTVNAITEDGTPLAAGIVVLQDAQGNVVAEGAIENGSAILKAKPGAYTAVVSGDYVGSAAFVENETTVTVTVTEPSFEGTYDLTDYANAVTLTVLEGGTYYIENTEYSAGWFMVEVNGTELDESYGFYGEYDGYYAAYIYVEAGDTVVVYDRDGMGGTYTITKA
ncbi:MAG: hypothetical protein ACI4NG_01475 [Candidatus Gallimonas sp.]